MAKLLKRIFSVLNSPLEWMVRGIPGGVGQRVRRLYWGTRLGHCGHNVRIDEGVSFHYPEHIEVGDDVWIMSGAVLTGPSGEEGALESNKLIVGTPVGDCARLRIGSEVQVGHFNILNGIGGLTIGNCVTLSARVSIYSATHLDRDPTRPSVRVGANSMVRSRPVVSRHQAVVIGDGAWLGLGVSVICASVGEDGFIVTGSVVTTDTPANAVMAGAPAVYKRDRFSGGVG